MMVSNVYNVNLTICRKVCSILSIIIFLGFINITTGYDKYEALCSEGEFDKICIPADYMKFELPSSEEATTVTIGVDIKDIPKVKDKDFSITINAYFIAKWRDVRLQIEERNRSRSGVKAGNETKLTPVNPEVFAKRLWLPDVG